MNTNKRALKSFRLQLQELDNLTSSQVSAWRAHTNDLIKKYMAPDSDFIDQFAGSYSLLGESGRYQSDIPQSKDIVKSCIRFIEQNGVYRSGASNFLSRIGDTALWTILGVGVPGLIGVGVFFGNMSSDKQNIELRQENKVLKDSLFVLRTLAVSANAKPNGNTKIVHKKAEPNKRPK